MNVPLRHRAKCNGRKAALLFGLAIVLALATWLFLTGDNFPGHEQMNSWLLQRLVSVNPLPDDFNKLHPHVRQAIYVLGGSQNDLRYRFKAAAALYRNDVSRKIFILTDPRITEYDPSLGRNLTNNEWAMKKLVEFGVKKEDIEPLSLKSGFFGTLREARTVTEEISNRGYAVLILVSSPYHTMRVRKSFSKYLRGKGINVFIYPSGGHPQLWQLLLEYLKLKIYDDILLYLTVPSSPSF
ncbi:MAG: YdcF family protein [Thermodesulfovibrionales bacterium]